MMLFVVFENFSAILKALDEIEQSSHNGRVTAEASGLRYQILKFELLVCLIVLKDPLFECGCISDYLQREDIDIVLYKSQTQQLTQSNNEECNNF